MLPRIALSLLLGATLLSAQAIPDRPEKLAFKPIVYSPPKAGDHRIKLPNGISAYLVEDPTGQPLVNIRVLIKGGSYQDPPGKEGATHLMGEILDSGGTRNLTADALAEELETLAARVSSTMDATSGYLQMNVLEKDTRKGMELFRDMLAHPAFQQDRLDLAKKQLRQGIERRNDDTTAIEQYQRGYLLRGEAHYTNRPVTAASLDAIGRSDLLALHAKLLHPQNLIVAVSGRFERKAMAKLLGETLGAIKAGPEAAPSAKVPAPEHTIPPGIHVCEKDVNQGRVSILLPGLRRADPDWAAVEVLNFILGGDFTSRLVMKIRTEEGLAYNVGSRFSPGPFYRGDFVAAFQTKVRTVAYGTRLALAELERIRTSPVTDEELVMAKGALIDRFPGLFSNRAAVASLFAHEEYSAGAPDYFSTYRERVAAVGKADIQRVAQKYLAADKAAILVVGGKADDLEAGDVKDHPGRLSEVAKLPVVKLPLRDPLTMKPLK